MMKFTKDFPDRSCPLEDERPIFENTAFAIGVTINLPRTKKFVRLQTERQKALLRNILKMALNRIEKDYLVTYEYHYEFCKDGNIHLHGLVFRQDKGELYQYLRGGSRYITKSIGFMMDLSRTLYETTCLCLKIKPEFKLGYCDKFKRVFTPMRTLQLLKDEEEYDRWVTYMLKES